MDRTVASMSTEGGERSQSETKRGCEKPRPTLGYTSEPSCLFVDGDEALFEAGEAVVELTEDRASPVGDLVRPCEGLLQESKICARLFEGERVGGGGRGGGPRRRRTASSRIGAGVGAEASSRHHEPPCKLVLPPQLQPGLYSGYSAAACVGGCCGAEWGTACSARGEDTANAHARFGAD